MLLSLAGQGLRQGEALAGTAVCPRAGKAGERGGSELEAPDRTSASRSRSVPVSYVSSAHGCSGWRWAALPAPARRQLLSPAPLPLSCRPLGLTSVRTNPSCLLSGWRYTRPGKAPPPWLQHPLRSPGPQRPAAPPSPAAGHSLSAPVPGTNHRGAVRRAAQSRVWALDGDVSATCLV